MTALDHATRTLVKAARRWKLAMRQTPIELNLAELYLERAIETHATAERHAKARKAREKK